MRQYQDPVEVRRGEAEDPDQFLWRGRLWKVRAVVAHWVETGPWWQGSGTGGAASDLVTERELWRVEAGRGAAGGVGPGTFDLCHDPVEDRWQLVGCTD